MDPSTYPTIQEIEYVRNNHQQIVMYDEKAKKKKKQNNLFKQQQKLSQTEFHQHNTLLLFE
jgi:hypothetical protein